MKYCLFSDIHSNLPALQSVINHSLQYNIDKYICLGDIVGYNSYPCECIDLLKNLRLDICAGNHDFAVLEKLNIDDFNNFAKIAVEWTKNNITENHKKYLSENLKTILCFENFEAVHGALTNPITDYMMNLWVAVTNFKLMKRNLCFVGHTHIPALYSQNADGKEPKTLKIEPFKKILLDKEKKYIANLGSVGQPRDNDPRASYMVFDDEEMSIVLNKTIYDIDSIQFDMRKKNFPEYLITRLSEGK